MVMECLLRLFQWSRCVGRRKRESLAALGAGAHSEGAGGMPVFPPQWRGATFSRGDGEVRKRACRETRFGVRQAPLRVRVGVCELRMAACLLNCV